MTGFKIRKLEALCFRYPLSTPVVTSFGRDERPSRAVRARRGRGRQAPAGARSGANFPAVGAEHRARLINEMLAPMLDRSRDRASLRSVRLSHRRDRGAGAAIGRARVRSRRRSPASTSRCGICSRAAPGNRCGRCSAACRLACASTPAASIRTAASRPQRSAMKRGHRAFKLKIGFRSGARPAQPSGPARAGRRALARSRRQSGLVARSGAAAGARAGRIST